MSSAFRAISSQKKEDRVLFRALDPPISYHDEQCIPRHFESKKGGSSALKRSSSKKEVLPKGSKAKGSGTAPPSSEAICVERIGMILRELLATECVEMYTPSMYNVLWDAIQRSPNLYVKAMALKLVTHLEVHWADCAVDGKKA